MPTINIDVVKVSKIPGAGQIVEIEANYGDLSIVRIINVSDFTNYTDFASWLINQQPDRQSLGQWRKRLAITFHNETVIDPETGASFIIRVVDAVSASNLPAP